MCFLNSNADHLRLHSFPTRRSSDLTAMLETIQSPEVGVCEIGHMDIIPDAGAVRRPVVLAENLERRTPRSEEHTSELQSQFHLVCRLLLEKKNLRHGSAPPGKARGL